MASRPRRIARECALAPWGRTAILLALGVLAMAAPTPAAPAPAQRPIGWRMDGTGNFPAATPTLEWSATHHVRWMKRMPSWSNSSPILVGERLFVSSEPDRLLCLRAADGEILWQRASPPEDAVANPIPAPPFLQGNARERELTMLLREKELELTRIRQRLRAAPDDEGLASLARAHAAEAAAMREELTALAPHIGPQIDEESGLSSPTPTSDGDAVYVLYATGIAASYDLSGQRRWIRFLDQPADRNDVSSSPVLAGDTLVVLVRDLIGLDKATGEVRWRVDVPHRNGTPIAFTIDAQTFVITPSGHCVRVADGAIVASDLGNLDYASPVIRDGVIYLIAEESRALRIPEHLTEPLAFRTEWLAHVKGSRFYASPLVIDGLVYALSRNQMLTVLDAKTGAEVYVQRLSLGEMGGVNSVYSSPTQGGGHVFLSALAGTTLVLAPERTFRPVATNTLEKFRASPVFDGDRMFLRGHENLYCIAAPTDGARPGSAAPAAP